MTQRTEQKMCQSTLSDIYAMKIAILLSSNFIESEKLKVGACLKCTYLVSQQWKLILNNFNEGGRPIICFQVKLVMKVKK